MSQSCVSRFVQSCEVHVDSYHKNRNLSTMFQVALLRNGAVTELSLNHLLRSANQDPCPCTMKLPAVNCRVSSGIAPKPTRLRSMSYGAVASPFIPAAPIWRDLRHDSGGQVRCASTSCRVFWRRRIMASDNPALAASHFFLCLLPIGIR